MKILDYTPIAPSCVIPLTHPARRYVPSHDTDIRATLERHQPLRMCGIRDDYELTDALGYLEQMGAFK